MQVRVGRRVYNKDGSFTDPEFPGFIKIICMTKSTDYGSLSPYELKNDKEQILENIWQFSKIYNNIKETTVPYSRYNNTTIWHHGSEKHIVKIDDKEYITEEYMKWRTKGFNNKFPVRYPIGYNDRHKCIGAIKTIKRTIIKDQENVDQKDKKTVIKLGSQKVLNYIDSRKEIYLPLYREMVKNKQQFLHLKKLLQSNNLLIIEVDGPHQESLDYYAQKYGTDDKFIENNTVLANKKNMGILLNDEKHPFGHGYCLAVCLQNIDL